MPAVAPVPPKATVICPPAMFALMVNSPVRLPVAVGVNVTFRLQLAPAAMLEFTQVSVSVKSPLIETDVAVSAVLPEFTSVTVCALLAVPIG